MVDTDQKFVHVDDDTTHCGVRAVVMLSSGWRVLLYHHHTNQLLIITFHLSVAHSRGNVSATESERDVTTGTRGVKEINMLIF